MSWKTIRAGLLVLLIIVNLALFWMNRLEQDRLYLVKDKDLRQVLELYEQNNIVVESVLYKESYPRAPILLGDADYLSPEMVERFLGADYRIVYMDGQQRQYTKGDETILLDPVNHRLVYTLQLSEGRKWSRERLKAWSASKVEECLEGGDVHWVCTEEKEGEWIYVQERDGEYLYFNRAIIKMSDTDSVVLEISYYEPLKYMKQTREVRPLDELMYGAMKTIIQRGDSESHVVTQIRHGYDLDASLQSVYCLEFVLANGRTVRINAYTNEVIN
ncbi:MAG: hypothetical protein IJ315_03570 [Firmicutes bacterium]|nr:hypothetical protein [Bacillota bacterium]